MKHSRTIAYLAAFAVLALAGACFMVSPEVLKPEEEASEPAPPSVTTKPPPVVSEEEERRNAQENRRRAHLNVIKLAIDRSKPPEIRITQRPIQASTSKYAFDRNIAGKYYITKQGVLLCEEGPCNIEWTVKFIYTDESGKSDAFLITSRETVFAGMGPTGTSRHKMDWCINGDCNALKELQADELRKEAYHERYALFLAKNALIIRRSDLMKEVLDAGRKLADY